MRIEYLCKYDAPLSVPEALKSHPIFAGPDPVGFISADSPVVEPQVRGGTQALSKELDRMGLKYEATNGKYGNPESSFIVYGPTREQMMDLGTRFGQEGVIHTNRGDHQLIYTNGEKKGKYLMGKPGGELFTEAPPDYYTRIPNKGYLRLHFDHNNLMDEKTTKSELHMAKDLEVNEIRQMLAKSIQDKIDEYKNRLVELRKRELSKADALSGQPQIPMDELRPASMKTGAGAATSSDPQEGLLSGAMMGLGQCPLCGMEDKPESCQCNPKAGLAAETNDPSLGDEPTMKSEKIESEGLKEKDIKEKPVEVGGKDKNCLNCGARMALCKCSTKKAEMAKAFPDDISALPGAKVQAGPVGGVAGLKARAQAAGKAVSPGGQATTAGAVPAAPLATKPQMQANASMVSPGPKLPAVPPAPVKQFKSELPPEPGSKRSNDPKYNKSRMLDCPGCKGKNCSTCGGSGKLPPEPKTKKGEDFIDLKNASDPKKRLKETGDNPGTMPEAGEEVSSEQSPEVKKGKKMKKEELDKTGRVPFDPKDKDAAKKFNEINSKQASAKGMEVTKPGQKLMSDKPVKKAAAVPTAKPPTAPAAAKPAAAKPAPQANPATKPAAMALPKPTLPKVGGSPTVGTAPIAPAAKGEMEKGMREFAATPGPSGLELGSNRPQLPGVKAVAGEATVKPIATGVARQHPPVKMGKSEDFIKSEACPFCGKPEHRGNCQ